MHSSTYFHLQLLFTSLSVAFVPSPLITRQTGGSCSTPDGAGTCRSTSDCTTTGFNLAGYCPGPADIQCCIKKTCSGSSGSGTCLNKSDKCSGSFSAGLCPGDSSIQCCITSSSTPPAPPPPPPPPPPSGSSGSSIVSAAVKEEGLPYIWGGGGCSGPSGGGFDCSGLTQYAVCQAGHGTIPRTAATQYASSMGHHLPRAQAQAGDLLFWATGGGNCAGGSGVAHVGIFMGGGEMVNAAHSGTPVREQAVWESSGGEAICPDAVRFW